jgi:phosphoglycerate dehydrogenase-like enzyme
VVVSNGAGIHAKNIAEHVLGSLLIFSRDFMTGFRQCADARWQHYQSFGELSDFTITVVGLGSVGTTVADRLSTFDVDTIGIRHSPEKGGPTEEVIGYGDHTAVHDAFGRSDYVVLACPLTETTTGLIDDVTFELMPTDAVLVNVARGPVVDTDALVSAVQGNEIRGAALDVTDPEPLPKDHPLWHLKDVLITPHVAGHTPEYWARLADILAETLDRYEEEGMFENATNRVV